MHCGQFPKKTKRIVNSLPTKELPQCTNNNKVKGFNKAAYLTASVLFTSNIVVPQDQNSSLHSGEHHFCSVLLYVEITKSHLCRKSFPVLIRPILSLIWHNKTTAIKTRIFFTLDCSSYRNTILVHKNLPYHCIFKDWPSCNSLAHSTVKCNFPFHFYALIFIGMCLFLKLYTSLRSLNHAYMVNVNVH